MSRSGPRVFCALDTVDADHAAALAETLGGAIDGIKLGLEFFSANGPAAVRRLAGDGLPLFLDLKFHDIPSTVAGAVGAVMPLAPAMMTVHAGGGPDMIRAARDQADARARDLNVTPPRLIAVTVLTSLDDDDLAAMGVGAPVSDHARQLAQMAIGSGADGVVCSPHEITGLRRLLGPGPLLVVPGIRPAGSPRGDQKRVMSATEAAALGADILVIGRPITADPDPLAAARRIRAELATG